MGLFGKKNDTGTSLSDKNATKLFKLFQESKWDVCYKYNEDEVILYHIVNNSAMNSHPLHIHGHQMKVIGLDGNPVAAPYVTNVLDISVAQTYDVEVICNNPNKTGNWVFHCHKLGHLRNPEQPWPNGADYPSGLFGNQDYTGWFMMYRSAISHRETSAAFYSLPPCADASTAG